LPGKELRKMDIVGRGTYGIGTKKRVLVAGIVHQTHTFVASRLWGEVGLGGLAQHGTLYLHFYAANGGGELLARRAPVSGCARLMV
jgi:hypothetical protein